MYKFSGLRCGKVVQRREMCTGMDSPDLNWQPGNPVAAATRWQRAIVGYRAGQLPLSVPLGVLQQLLAAFPDRYLEQQVYLTAADDDVVVAAGEC